MDNQTQKSQEQTEQSINFQDVTQNPQNAAQNNADLENTVLEDVIGDLTAIEPAAGEQAQQTGETAQDILNSNSFKAALEVFDAAGSIDAVGILDETALEYGVGNFPVFTASDIIFAPAAPLQNIVQSVALDAPVIQEVVLPKADIRLSNATTNQRFINDADHYQIDAQVIGKTHKLFGEEMDIRTVSDEALVHYKFKAEDSFRAVLKSGWNAVKNIDVESEDLNIVTVKNFVHADIDLNGDADKTVKIINAKRGFVETDAGDDVIIIKAQTNGSGWSNTFEIDSGAGDDKITIKGDDGHTIADIQAGSGDDLVKMRGQYERSDIDLGAGNDIFKPGKHEDIVRGGAGDDIIKGGAGNDVLYGGDIILPEASLIAAQLDFEFVKSQAGYKNAVGFYTLAEDGTIENTQIVFENLKALQPGDHRMFETGVEESVKTFIIANGYNRNARWSAFDLENGEFSFVYNHGEADERAANINDDAGAISLVYHNGAQEIVVKGHVFHDIEALNTDGQDHTLETVNGNESAFAYEDLYNLGDRDFSDAVFTLTEKSVYALSYGSGAEDSDRLYGGADNDVIVGGYGDDLIKSGSGVDIAVFMGRADEYIITKSGGKYTFEDTVEGRDGTDTLQSVEGLLFGVEDLYLDILNGWSEAQVDQAFDVENAEDLTLSDLLEGYSPIQNAIDSFVHNAETSTVETVSVSGDVAALAIMNAEDALSNSYAASSLTL